MMDLVRAPDSVPSVSVPGQGDHPTAVSLFAGVMMALYRRQLTGKGSEVSTSLLANGMWANGCYLHGKFEKHDFPDRVTRLEAGKR